MRTSTINRNNLTNNVKELIVALITNDGANYYRVDRDYTPIDNEVEPHYELLYQTETQCIYGIKVDSIDEASCLVMEGYDTDNRKALDEVIYGADCSVYDYWGDTYAQTHGWWIE